MSLLESGSTDRLIASIQTAFAATPRPPDAFLVGSRDGCEPEEAVAPFHGRDWRGLDAGTLDGHDTALSFFSEGGLRYFMPAPGDRAVAPGIQQRVAAQPPRPCAAAGLDRGLGGTEEEAAFVGALSRERGGPA